MSMWRRRWDSNPRYGYPYGGFQDRCLKPLDHSSVMRANRTSGQKIHVERDLEAQPAVLAQLVHR
jgi:hypothetical protein